MRIYKSVDQFQAEGEKNGKKKKCVKLKGEKPLLLPMLFTFSKEMQVPLLHYFFSQLATETSDL